jgi:hypothetical protein
MGTAARDQAHGLFAQTMGYVAVTAGLFALGDLGGPRPRRPLKAPLISVCPPLPKS